MKAVQLHAYGDVDQLRYEDVPDPKPEPGEYLVRVKATSINPVDWKLRAGHAKQLMQLTFPAILGRDVAGEIVSGGSGANSFKPGAKVMGLVNHAYAEYLTAKPEDLAVIPDGLDWEQAAVLPLVTLTGAQLIERGVVPEAGQTVLVTGALGGVGRTAVYVAKQHGARVIAGVRANQKHGAVSLGASQIVALDVDAEIASMPELDAIADTVGGPVVQKLAARLKKGGVFASVLGKPQGIDGNQYRIAPIISQPDASRMHQLAVDAAGGKFTIPIAKRFKLSEIRDAQTAAEKGGGKIVVTP